MRPRARLRVVRRFTGAGTEPRDRSAGRFRQVLRCWMAGASRAAVATVMAVSGPQAPAFAAEPPVIAAASDLQHALAEAAEAFASDIGREVRLSFGSSGNLARQIRQGAPFELFLSADERFALDLAREGRTDGEGALYAVGRLAIFTARGSPVRADAEMHDLAAAIGDGRLKRLAIANPEHAPYGRAAREALRHAGLWERVEPRLALGENVSQAAQFAASGAAQAGLIAYSLARAPSLEGKGAYALIPDSWHAPLRQRMVLTRGAGATARAFYEYLQQPKARAALERYGFSLPEER